METWQDSHQCLGCAPHGMGKTAQGLWQKMRKEARLQAECHRNLAIFQGSFLILIRVSEVITDFIRSSD